MFGNALIKVSDIEEGESWLDMLAKWVLDDHVGHLGGVL